ncbi:hypothetical protein AAVH_21860 [Aphelenchoides avenae]|nr:hypothetical protein AAVH_21860 [Aphelenchus avenae]
MLNSRLSVRVAALCFVALQLLAALMPAAEAYPRTIALARRNDDFDSLLSELKSKGSRMRFGKRSDVAPASASSSAEDSPTGNRYYRASPDAGYLRELVEDPTVYSADRYMWLQ